MQRLRGLSEAECYLRCYGDRVETVSLVELEARYSSLVDLSEQHLLLATEGREPNELSEEDAAAA
jgi:hypothetical protein